MAPSRPNVLRKVPRFQQETGMTFLELERLFLLNEYGGKKAHWAVQELITSAMLQTKRSLKNERGEKLYFAIFWPYSGIPTDTSRVCNVIWGKRREYVIRADGREDQPWILDD